LNRIAKKYGIDFEERPLPTNDDVTAIVSERTTVLLEAQQRDKAKDELAKLHNYHLARISVGKDDHVDKTCGSVINAIVNHGGKFLHDTKLYDSALKLHKATKLYADLKQYNKFKLVRLYANAIRLR